MSRFAASAGEAALDLHGRLPSLSENRAARIAAILVLYFLQGVPIGLTLVALPGWLAEQGVSPLAIGGFVGLAMLPWSTKLLNGLVMDRFTFMPMGRRRSWILAAQALMVAALVTMALIAPGARDVAMLTALCFVLNVCVTFSDVAVDGMAVDIVPEDERTMINGFMFASQNFGVAACAFLAGQLLASGSLRATALVLAGFVICASVFVGLFRERPGERLLPWTPGAASRECMDRQHDAWWPILSGVFRSVISPPTLLFLLGAACSSAMLAFCDAVNPTLAVQHLGWSSERYSSLGALMSLIAAGCALFVPLALVRWFGLRRAVICHFLLIALLAAVAAATFPSWQGDGLFMALTLVLFILSVLLTVLLVVWAMRISDPAIAASQFALFMAVPNLSRSMMSGNSGWLVEGGGYPATYLAVVGITLLGLGLCLIAGVGDERAVEAGTA